MVPSALAVLFICSVPETVDLTVATVPAWDAPLVSWAKELVIKGASLRVATYLIFSLMAIQVAVTLLHCGQALTRLTLELIEGACDISCMKKMCVLHESKGIKC